MIIIRIIHVCNTCERREMQRLTLNENFLDINVAIKNVEYNQGLTPNGWSIIHNDDKEELQCPTCRQQKMIKEFDEKLKSISEGKRLKKLRVKHDKIVKEKKPRRDTGNDITCMSFFT